MTFLPLRLRPMKDGNVLCVNDTGQHFTASEDYIGRLAAGVVANADARRLRDAGHILETDDPLGWAAHARGVAERLSRAGSLDYLILVPTLRCNLACSYCQVSRVGVKREGFDWSETTLAAVIRTIDALPTNRIKIEFQGGEPTLRPDLIRAVIAACERFEEHEFVICTNLNELNPEILKIFDRPDVFISTSLDGDASTHGHNRTGDKGATAHFFMNLRTITSRYGPRKVSALPTVDPSSPPDVDSLIEAYASHGFDSIFLRPINFQGFARKRHKGSREQDDAWRAYYGGFVQIGRAHV